MLNIAHTKVIEKLITYGQINVGTVFSNPACPNTYYLKLHNGYVLLTEGFQVYRDAKELENDPKELYKTHEVTLTIKEDVASSVPPGQPKQPQVPEQDLHFCTFEALLVGQKFKFTDSNWKSYGPTYTKTIEGYASRDHSVDCSKLTKAIVFMLMNFKVVKIF